MPPVVIGIIQTLTEGQSVTDKLLGLSLISQLLLFRLTLQLNREGTTVDLLRKREGDKTEQRQWKRREKRGIQRIRRRGKGRKRKRKTGNEQEEGTKINDRRRGNNNNNN